MTKKTKKKKTRTVYKDLYYEAGDFRSDMSLTLLKESDIVVTNPPFSLFRECVAQLMKYKKKFIIIGSQNAITYKEIFPLLKENKLWLGYNSGDMAFTVPDYYSPRETRYWEENGIKYRSMGNICWYTNIDHAKRHQMLPLDLGYTYKGHKDMYPKYDNYDAINVDKVNQIPCDYKGVMGVPITFLDKFCPEQFEIVGMAEDNGRGYSGERAMWDGKNPHCVIYGKNKFKRLFIIKKD